MSDDITRPEARPLTSTVEGGDANAKHNLFLDTMRQAAAFAVYQQHEGTITAEQCQDRIDAIQLMSSELRFGGACACDSCGEATNYLFVDHETAVCVWCIQARCNHINHSDNLTGATCDDCGKEA